MEIADTRGGRDVCPSVGNRIVATAFLHMANNIHHRSDY